MLRPSIHRGILYHFLLLITSISAPYFFNILQYVRVLFIVCCYTTRYQDHYFAWLPSSLLHPVYVYVLYVLQYILYTLHTFLFSKHQDLHIKKKSVTHWLVVLIKLLWLLDLSYTPNGHDRVRKATRYILLDKYIYIDIYKYTTLTIYSPVFNIFLKIEYTLVCSII